MTSTSSDSTGGEWVPTPIADVKDGDRVRACGVEGTAGWGIVSGDLYIRVGSSALTFHDDGGTGAVLDVWAPAPPHLPLPTDRRLFWGCYDGGEGWCYGPIGGDVRVLPPSSLAWLRCADVTRLPIPAAELAALTDDEALQGGDDRG